MYIGTINNLVLLWCNTTCTAQYVKKSDPSLFFFHCLPLLQACRGAQHDEPVIATDSTDSSANIPETNTTEVDAASVYTLPAGADFIMCYSVAEG